MRCGAVRCDAARVDRRINKPCCRRYKQYIYKHGKSPIGKYVLYFPLLYHCEQPEGEELEENEWMKCAETCRSRDGGAAALLCPAQLSGRGPMGVRYPPTASSRALLCRTTRTTWWRPRTWQSICRKDLLLEPELLRDVCNLLQRGTCFVCCGAVLPLPLTCPSSPPCPELMSPCVSMAVENMPLRHPSPQHLGADAITKKSRQPLPQKTRAPQVFRHPSPFSALRKHITQLGDLFSAPPWALRAPSPLPRERETAWITVTRAEVGTTTAATKLPASGPVSATSLSVPKIPPRPAARCPAYPPGRPPLSSCTFYFPRHCFKVNLVSAFVLALRSGPGSRSRFCHVFRDFPLREIPCTADIVDT